MNDVLDLLKDDPKLGMSLGEEKKDDHSDAQKGTANEESTANAKDSNSMTRRCLFGAIVPGSGRGAPRNPSTSLRQFSPLLQAPPNFSAIGLQARLVSTSCLLFLAHNLR